MNWIESVNKLPEEMVEVWIALADGRVKKAFRQWMPSFRGWFIPKEGRLSDEQVSHWAQIEYPAHPEPKEVEPIDENQTSMFDYKRF